MKPNPTVIYDEEAEIYNVYDLSKNQTGYAFLATGSGYSGQIVILIGLEGKETIKGIIIVEHYEYEWNPHGHGPGDRLTEREFIDQFIGLKIDDCYLKKGGGQVDGITGASTSSKAVVDIVREAALEKFKPTGSKIKWQIVLTLSIVIPFILIPMVLMWYTTVKQARAKRATNNEGGQ